MIINHISSVRILFAIFLIVLSQHVPAQSDSLTGSGGGIIAFTSNRDGNLEIYLMNADGTSQLNVTNSNAEDIAGRWSRDGNRLAFISTRDSGFEIYIMDVIDITNGIFSEPQRITFHENMETSITWSPNGTKIAFSTQVGGVPGIYIYDLVNGGDFQHLETSPVDGFQPSWSPIENKIAFGSPTGLYTINTDGSELFQLTTEFVNVPVWSPDGSRIAYVAGSPDEDIYIINADGTGNVCITTSPYHDFVPSWSPDGTMFVYEDERHGNDEIYTMDVSGSNVTRLTNIETNTGPLWRPDPGTTPVKNQINQLIPKMVHLYQNYPNPFNPNTQIKYYVPQRSFVSLRVYDVLGNKVSTLVNEEKPPGSYEVELDGTGISSGIYFYELRVSEFNQVRKMILIK